jgi:hypothetical protein
MDTDGAAGPPRDRGGGPEPGCRPGLPPSLCDPAAGSYGVSGDAGRAFRLPLR